jgi:hypothetical protein
MMARARITALAIPALVSSHAFLGSAPSPPAAVRDSQGVLWYVNAFGRFWFRFAVTLATFGLVLLPVAIVVVPEGLGNHPRLGPLVQAGLAVAAAGALCTVPVLLRLSAVQRIGIGAVSLLIETRSSRQEIPWRTVNAVERTHDGNSLRLILVDGRLLRLRALGEAMNRVVETAFAESRTAVAQPL